MGLNSRLDVKIAFLCRSMCRYVLVCMCGEEFLNTLSDLTPLMGYVRIFCIARPFVFSLFCNLGQFRCFVVIMKSTHEPNSDSICCSPNLNTCRTNDFQRKKRSGYAHSPLRLDRAFVMYIIPEGNNVNLTGKIVRWQTWPMTVIDIGNGKQAQQTRI